jgi:hypothetical protein
MNISSLLPTQASEGNAHHWTTSHVFMSSSAINANGGIHLGHNVCRVLSSDSSLDKWSSNTRSGEHMHAKANDHRLRPAFFVFLILVLLFQAP